MPPAWLDMGGGGLRVLGIERVGVRTPDADAMLLVADRVEALDPERPREPSRIAWGRSKVGVRGDSGVGLEVNRDPWLMRIFGGAEEDGKEGGARSDTAIVG